MTQIRKRFNLPFFIFMVCIVVSTASGEDKLFEKKGPFIITSSTLIADNKAHTALFEGSVTAKSDNMTIHSDRMLVYYPEGGKITKIEAEGHVKLIRNERIITSDAATYFAEDERVVFTGQPKAIEGNNIVSGTKMTFFIKEDRSLVENSRVFIEGGSSKSR